MGLYRFPSSSRFIEKKIDHFSGVEVKIKWLQCFVHVIQGISVQKEWLAPPKVAYRGVCFQLRKMVGIERFVKNKSKEKKSTTFDKTNPI